MFIRYEFIGDGKTKLIDSNFEVNIPHKCHLTCAIISEYTIRGYSIEEVGKQAALLAYHRRYEQYEMWMQDSVLNACNSPTRKLIGDWDRFKPHRDLYYDKLLLLK